MRRFNLKETPAMNLIILFATEIMQQRERESLLAQKNKRRESEGLMPINAGTQSYNTQ